MDSTPMPEPLRRAVHQLVSEAVSNCQEVLRYTEPDQAHSWKRMTMYRATDAADTMDMAALLIAAYCQYMGMPDVTHRYLQAGNQHNRAAGPQQADLQEVAGLLGEPAPSTKDRGIRLRHVWGQRHAEDALTPEDAPERLLTEACLHGLRARLSDDVDSLDSFLPPRIAQMARKVAEVLEEPQPAPA